jgi:glycosyltransferase involved in cell wall biosynthesis
LLSETPVVAYRSGGVVDLVEHGVTGILVDPGAVDELGSSINALLDDPLRAEAMGKVGRERMLVRFSPATAAAAYLDIYRTVEHR